MTRQEKQETLELLNQMYGENEFVFLIGMNAVNASAALSFRADVRKTEAECMVIKNTLSKIAAKEAGVNGLEGYFSKQVLTIFTNNPVEVAKLLDKYSDKGYSVIAGSDKQNIFSASDVKKLATMPSLPVMRSMLLSTILGVHTKTVRVLSESAASLVRLISAANKNKQ